MSNNKRFYYAVKKGFEPGIYNTWAECKEQIDGYSHPKFRKFPSREEANKFINCSDEEVNTYVSGKQKISTKKHLLKFKDEIISSPYSDKLKYKVGKWNYHNDEFYIFTDGSSKKTSTGVNSGYAIYLGKECVNIKEISNDKTNNQCELGAIDIAFKIIVKCMDQLIKYNKKINVVSDSDYSIKATSVWLAKWKANNWRTVSGNDVKNKEIITSIDDSMNQIRAINSKLPASSKVKVKFIHTNSHQDMPDKSDPLKCFIWEGNLIVDGLAENFI